MLKLWFVTLIVAILLASPLYSQWIDKLPPASSPYWWTLTDEVSPQQLRSQYSKQRHKERYQQAVEEGKREPLSAHDMDDILIFVDGRLTPEYNRLPEVLGRLCAWLAFSPDELASQLHGAGFSSAEIEFLSQTARARDLEMEELGRANGEKASQFLALLKRASETFPREEFRRVLRTRSYGRLSQISGYSQSQIKDKAEAWAFEPLAEVDLSTAIVVKNGLSQESWSRLRSFLLRDVSPSGEYFELGDGELETEL